MLSSKKQNLFTWLLHNYLFIRVPLFKPDKFLSSSLFFVNFFYTKLWTRFVLLLGFIGIVLVLRDWEMYLATFDNFFTQESLFYYFLSLIFIKSLHELGHAFTAKRYGCTVPTMGVAFLVLFPLLYTDTTDAWKLQSKKERLAIVFAGIKVELYIAMLATFLYSFTPEGPLKSIFFILATTSWITSLLLNISPFLRFDGYYALSDWTESENLQARSFAMAKWFLRKNILGLNEEVPEYLTQRKRNFFILYAILTWIYRLILFLGIALLVYYFAFKLLGILLFIIEILYFILLPIFKELHIWWKKRHKVQLNMKNIFSLLLLGLMLAYLFIPKSTNIQLSAVLKVKNYINIYPNENAQIQKIYIHDGDFVKKGTLLMQLYSKHSSYSLEICKIELKQLQNEIQKYASSKEVLEKIYILQESLIRKEAQLTGLQKLQEKLSIKAPFDGFISFHKTYEAQQWVNTKDSLFSIYDTSDRELIGFLNEEYLNDVSITDKAYFIADIPDLKTIPIQLNIISEISSPHLRYPELSSKYDGEIPTRDDKKLLYTQNALYKVHGTPLIKIEIFHSRIKGKLIIRVKTRSLFQEFYRTIASVMIRESGF